MFTSQKIRRNYSVQEDRSCIKSVSKNWNRYRSTAASHRVISCIIKIFVRFLIYRRKLEVWRKLTDEFNMLNNGVYRNEAVLRGKFDNKKRDFRKKMAEEKRKGIQPGGGITESIAWDESDKDMADILGISVTGFTTELDDDNSFGKK